MLFKSGEILGNITNRYPNGDVDVNYAGTVMTLPGSENELVEKAGNGTEVRDLKILYIHGLDATPESDHVEILNGNGITIVAPNLTYERGSLFERLSNIIERENIKGIVGHSYGGYFAYCLSNKYKIPCLMFNPYFGEKNSLHPIPDSVKELAPYHSQMLVLGSEDDMFLPQDQMDIFKESGCKIFVEKIDHDIPDDIKIKYFDKFIERKGKMTDGGGIEPGWKSIKGMDTIGREIPNWDNAIVYHSTDIKSAKNINEVGYKILNNGEQAGYYGVAVSFTPDIEYTKNFGEVVTVARIKKGAKILNLNDEKDWQKWLSTIIKDAGTNIRKYRSSAIENKIDGVYDPGAGDLFIYNTDVVNVVEVIKAEDGASLDSKKFYILQRDKAVEELKTTKDQSRIKSLDKKIKNYQSRIDYLNEIDWNNTGWGFDKASDGADIDWDFGKIKEGVKVRTTPTHFGKWNYRYGTALEYIGKSDNDLSSYGNMWKIKWDDGEVSDIKESLIEKVKMTGGGILITNSEKTLNDLLKEQIEFQKKSEYAILLEWISWEISGELHSQIMDKWNQLEKEITEKLGADVLFNYSPFSMQRKGDSATLMFDENGNVLGLLDYNTKTQYHYSASSTGGGRKFDESYGDIFYIDYIFSFSKGNGQKMMQQIKKYANKYNVSIGLEGSVILKSEEGELMASAEYLEKFYTKQGFENIYGNYFIYKPDTKFKAEDGAEIPVMDEETYLSINGASRQDIGESALHKNRGGASDKAWKRIIDAQAQKDTKLLARRQKLREEYNEKVAKGEIRPPSRYEKLISTAQGHPDNEAVQAARRILERKGISWLDHLNK